jgi:surfeit locus 1 family protein
MRYRLRTTPLMFFLFVLFFGVFSALSAWQVIRVFEKQAIADRIEQASQQAGIEVADEDGDNLLTYEYYSARASGSFLADRCFYVENVIRQGKPGLYLYCPFELGRGERLLLVNLGWMARPRERFDLPAISVQTGPVNIQGVIRQPSSKPVVMTQDGKPNIELEHLWAYFDFDHLNQVLDHRLLPVELQLTTELQPDLQRQWSGYDPKLGMHIGYAIHWAAFALVTLGLFIKFNVKKDASDD